MQKRVSVLLTLLVAASMLLAGCVSGSAHASFSDADQDMRDQYTGGYNEQKRIDVPAGTDRLRVALHVDSTGGFTLQFMDPLGRPVQSVDQGGVYEKKDNSWYTTSNPTPGNWRIVVSAGGTGSFSVGAYLD